MTVSAKFLSNDFSKVDVQLQQQPDYIRLGMRTTAGSHDDDRRVLLPKKQKTKGHIVFVLHF